jgi:hypothetical protein
MILLGLALALSTSRAVHAAPIEWPVAQGGNGHFYEMVLRDPGPVGWHQARAEATAMQWMGVSGHLATITSPEEQEFIRITFPDPPDIYIGGFQDRSAPNYLEPSGGWRWITGEPWAFTNWRIGEPNNCTDCVGFPEDFLHIGGSSWPMWNDNHDAALSGRAHHRGYMVEFPVPIPEPSGLTLIAAMFAVLAAALLCPARPRGRRANG